MTKRWYVGEIRVLAALDRLDEEDYDIDDTEDIQMAVAAVLINSSGGMFAGAEIVLTIDEGG